MAENKTIATTFAGLFVKSTPWKNAHVLWFEKAAKTVHDSSILEWTQQKDYFKGVDIVMKKLHPDKTDEQRTTIARESYFEAVCEYIQKNPQCINKEIITFFQTLKTKYTLVLASTNTDKVMQKIMAITNTNKLFDNTYCSFEYEKDNKLAVFERMIREIKPTVYIGSDREETFELCKQEGIHAIYVNFENNNQIANVPTATTISELKQKLNNLNITYEH